MIIESEASIPTYEDMHERHDESNEWLRYVQGGMGLKPRPALPPQARPLGKKIVSNKQMRGITRS